MLETQGRNRRCAFGYLCDRPTLGHEQHPRGLDLTEVRQHFKDLRHVVGALDNELELVLGKAPQEAPDAELIGLARRSVGRGFSARTFARQLRSSLKW